MTFAVEPDDAAGQTATMLTNDEAAAQAREIAAGCGVTAADVIDALADERRAQRPDCA